MSLAADARPPRAHILMGWISAVILTVGVPTSTYAEPDGSTETSRQNEGRPAPRFELDLRIGGAWNLLSKPNDARGDPTLMDGAAFRGVAAVGGLAARYVWSAGRSSKSRTQNADSTRKGPSWVLELDVLYARHRATAVESSDENSASRRAVLHAGILHVPFLAGYRVPWPIPSHPLQIGAGPVLLHGLHSDVEVEVTGGTGQTRGLGTVNPTHLGATLQLATTLPAGPVDVPLEMRALWNPMAGDTTLERLRNYQSPQNPGDLEAAFDWQIFILVGLQRAGTAQNPG